MTDTRDTAPLVLGTEKIGKLLMQYAIPAIIAMTASSLYNMVDSIFIGHGVGPLAIAGLAITFPFMNLAAEHRRWLLLNWDRKTRRVLLMFWGTW